jgi:hypothetical protein
MVRVLVISILLSSTIASATLAADVRASRATARRPLAPSAKVLRYAQHVLDEHDANGDGQLDEAELGGMEGNPRIADANRDGAVTASEFAKYVAMYGFRRRIRLMPAVPEERDRSLPLLSPTVTPSRRERAGLTRNGIEATEPSGRTSTASDAPLVKKQRIPRKYTVSRDSLPQGLPSWFLVRDRDGDAQLTLAEYARDGSETSIREFSRYDANGDGVVTPDECLRAPRAMGLAGARSGETKRPIAEGVDADMGDEVTGQTKRTVPEKPTKEEIRQRYLNKALLRKNQSNRTNRTSRDRSAVRD